MTYNVFSGTLNPTQSINQSINQSILHSSWQTVPTLTMGSSFPQTCPFP